LEEKKFNQIGVSFKGSGSYVPDQILSNQKKNKFQPMPASFGLVPELSKRIKDKKLRYEAYQERSTEVLKGFRQFLDSRFEKDHLLIKTN